MTQDLQQKITDLQIQLEDERRKMRISGKVLDWAMRGEKHPEEQPHDGRMEAVRQLYREANRND